MRANIIGVLIIVFGYNLNAQITSLDIIGGIGQSYRVLSDETNRDLEEPKISWKAGILMNIKLAEAIKLKTGIIHNQVSYYEMILTDITWPSEHNGNGGFEDDPSLPNEIKHSVNFRFIEIPLDFRYEFFPGKLQPYFELGLSTSLYRATKTVNNTDIGYDSFTSKDAAISDINFFGNVAVGINYQIYPEYQLLIQGGYQQQLNTLREANIDEKLYQYGIVFGFRKLMGPKSNESK